MMVEPDSMQESHEEPSPITCRPRDHLQHPPWQTSCMQKLQSIGRMDRVLHCMQHTMQHEGKERCTAKQVGFVLEWP
jgi:hypothetical protein